MNKTIVMAETEWLEKYKPIKNTFYRGYEFWRFSNADEMNFVKAQDIHTIWTRFVNDSGTGLSIRNGMQYSNRDCYFVTTEKWNDDESIIIHWER